MKNFSIKQLESLKSDYNEMISLIFAIPEMTQQQLRIHQRYYGEPTDKENIRIRKEILRELDDDFQIEISNKFHQFAVNHPLLVDHVPKSIFLPSTSTKQAVSNLLKTINVPTFFETNFFNK